RREPVGRSASRRTAAVGSRARPTTGARAASPPAERGDSPVTARPQPTPAPLVRSDVLVSARSLREYTDMFGLGPEDLKRRILDCPGGAASAVAEISADGGTAVAVDPEYALGADELRARVLADLDRSVLYTRERDDQFDWDVRGAAAERMLADLEAAPERYVAGALPSLPFASDSADLALCSHLLFTYADRLDAADHVAAIVEMARVASEVRIYPLVDHWGT